jgi:hypothetical protein
MRVYSRILAIEIASLRGLGSIWTPEDGASGKIASVTWRWELYRQHRLGSPKTFLTSHVTLKLMGCLINGHNA